MSLLDELRKQSVPKELAFPDSEYQARIGKVRDSMNAAGLDALLLTTIPNICYLTGYQTAVSGAYAAAIVPLSGEVTLHLPDMEVPNAVLTSCVEDIAVIPWNEVDKAAHLAKTLKERGFDNKKIGIESGKSTTFAIGALDVRTYLRLQELLPDAQFKDHTYLVLDVRLIKSPAEISYMRRAGEMSYIGLQAAIAEIAPGKTDNDLAAAAYAALVSAGSELMCIDPMILTGYRSGWGPHSMYKRTPIKVGDPIYMECSGCFQRYNAPMMRCASLGRPSDDVRRLADYCAKTLELLLVNIRAGRTAHDVAVAVKNGLGKHEGEIYFHSSFSYSVGLGFQPQWSDAPMYISEGNHQLLKAGMTLHLPNIHVVPGRFGVGLSETVAVTNSGCDLLTPGKDRQLVTCLP